MRSAVSIVIDKEFAEYQFSLTFQIKSKGQVMRTCKVINNSSRLDVDNKEIII